MEPEVIANLWTFNGAFADKDFKLSYQVGIRPYMVTGSDDEKFELLRALAGWDFHLAHMFPLSCGTTHLTGLPGGGSMEVEGVMPAGAPGLEVMDWCQNAFDGIEALLPEHPSAEGTMRAHLDLTNLLTVHTAVDVDENGNMIANTSDPKLARKAPTTAANLWAFADARSTCVHALTGRAYLLTGKRKMLNRILTNLSANDYLLGHRLPVPESISATIDGQAVPGRADVSTVSSQQDLLFAPVMEQIDREIPDKHADWQKTTTHRYTLRQDSLTHRVSVIPETHVPPTPIETPGSPPAAPSARGSEDMIVFQCPNCKSDLRVHAGKAGRSGKCPKCRGSITVPPATT
ncbi:MAG: hypothetical protein ISS69_04045 [Phycisphaerae bacterium]|nr:hypothetical protein [Phycisphaerae bacterium]